MAPADLNPLAGTKYRLLRQLGEGGMGEVYLVEHSVLGKTMVAKVLRADLSQDPGVVDRMRIEAQALGALSRPNIVSVTDFGETEHRRPFYVMEHLEGGGDPGIPQRSDRRPADRKSRNRLDSRRARLRSKRRALQRSLLSRRLVARRRELVRLRCRVRDRAPRRGGARATG